MSGRDLVRPMAPQHGFTYIGLMIFVALIGIGLAFVGQVWHTSAQREKERELIFVGDQFRGAIAAFNADNKNVSDGYPKTFEELLADSHAPGVRRYLRKIYRDPLTNSSEWGVLRSSGGGIMGVYSLAEGVPLKRQGFPPADAAFETADSYSKWLFVAIAPTQDKPMVAVAPPPASMPAAAKPPVPSPAAGGTTTPDPPIPKKANCADVARDDRNTCSNMKARYGDAADCEASAGEREAACASGAALQDLPLLIYRN
jgi:type II secretory pathway pseudopilin PulG